jgi:hypothetical protein
MRKLNDAHGLNMKTGGLSSIRIPSQKSLLEMESLPQIRNLLEMSEISSAAKEGGGVEDEANDEGKKADCGGRGRAIPAGAQEKKTAILNEFVELSGFARSYGAMVLRNQGRVVQVNRKLRVRGDVGKRARPPGLHLDCQGFRYFGEG